MIKEPDPRKVKEAIEELGRLKVRRKEIRQEHRQSSGAVKTFEELFSEAEKRLVAMASKEGIDSINLNQVFMLELIRTVRLLNKKLEKHDPS